MSALGSDEPLVEQRVYTSRLKGRPLLDGEGLIIGRIRDVVLLPAIESEPPRAIGLVVHVRRRRIFVGLGRIGEIAVDGAHLLGGTVDLREFTQRADEILVSTLYGRHTPRGTVTDVAIVPRELPRNGWEVSLVALSDRGLLRHNPVIAGWEDCRELFEPGPLAHHLLNLRDMRPADLAAAIDKMPMSKRDQLAAALDDAELADVLEEMPEADQVQLLASIGLERSADVVEEMQPDDAADLLAEMPPEQRERLLTAMHNVSAADVRRLMLYDAATAGGLMTSLPLIFSPDRTVAEALARIRDSKVPAAAAAQIFVCEPPTATPTGRFLGSVGFQKLLRRPPAVELGECIDASVYVSPDLSDQEVATRLAAYNLISVAVCDEKGRLVGAVTVDDVLDHVLPTGWRRRKGA